MKIKVTIKYHIEVGDEIIECESFEQAERKLKHMTETERYLIKTELKLMVSGKPLEGNL